MNKNLHTNGFLLSFKIYFHNIHSTPSHLLWRTVWKSLDYGLKMGVMFQMQTFLDDKLSDWSFLLFKCKVTL
jgi:hypothetical protein